MVKFKDFSSPLSVFPVLFKTNLIFKDFSRQSCIFKLKYISSLCEPLYCPTSNKKVGSQVPSHNPAIAIPFRLTTEPKMMMQESVKF